MIRILCDFNGMYEGGDNAVVLNEKFVPPEVLVPGTRVILYEPGLEKEVEMECEAIVRRGKIWPWIGEIVKGTFKYPDK